MSTQPLTAEAAPGKVPPTAAEKLLSYSYCWGPNADWWPILKGISIAGAFYPTVAGMLILAYFLITNLMQDFSFMMLFTVILGGLYAVGSQAAIGLLVGWLYACIVGFVVLFILAVVLRSLRANISPLWVGAFAGGLTGFLCTWFAYVPMFVFDPTQWPFGVWFVLVGPGVATIMGQLGGAWGGRQIMRSDTDYWAQWIEARQAASVRRFQFRIYHLMWLVVWCSVFLAAIRLVRLPYGPTLITFFVWLVFQTALLYLGGAIIESIRKRDRRNEIVLEPLHVEQSAE